MQEEKLFRNGQKFQKGEWYFEAKLQSLHGELKCRIFGNRNISLNIDKKKAILYPNENEKTLFNEMKNQRYLCLNLFSCNKK